MNRSNIIHVYFFGNFWIVLKITPQETARQVENVSNKVPTGCNFLSARNARRDHYTKKMLTDKTKTMRSEIRNGSTHTIVIVRNSREVLKSFISLKINYFEKKNVFSTIIYVYYSRLTHINSRLKVHTS